MPFNSSRLPDSWCSFLLISISSKSGSVYYQLTLTACVFTSLMVPMTVGRKCVDFGSNLEEPVSLDSILCSSCWFVLHRLLQWIAKSTILCFVQISGISREENTDLLFRCCHTSRWILFFLPNSHRHDNNSCRKMAAHESKNSSYSASSRNTLYHVCSSPNCARCCAHVRLVLYEQKL